MNDQQEQNEQQEQGQWQAQHDGGDQGNLFQQQVNPWEPCQAWPDELPAQQMVQPVRDLNAEPEVENGMELDLNLPAQQDPLEVVINPVNSLGNNSLN